MSNAVEKRLKTILNDIVVKKEDSKSDTTKQYAIGTYNYSTYNIIFLADDISDNEQQLDCLPMAGLGIASPGVIGFTLARCSADFDDHCSERFNDISDLAATLASTA